MFYLILKVQTFNLIIHAILLYTFLIKFNTGILGVVIIFNINGVLNYIVTIFCIRTKYAEKSDDGKIMTSTKSCFFTEVSFSRCSTESIKAIFEYLKFGIPSSVMFCMEVWFLEGLTVISGLISIDDQGACIILINICASFGFMIPFGMAYAASNLVGNSLGAGKANNARIYALVIWTFSII